MSKKIEKSQEVFDAARQREAELTKTPVDTWEEPVRKRERPNDLVVVNTGASYWKFEDEPVMEGCYVGPFLAPKDIPQSGGKITKKGEVIGHNFVVLATGEMTIIKTSYSIDKALNEDGFDKTTIWWLEFIEKTEVNGRPFNRFYIAKRGHK